MADVFISYSKADREHVAKLADQLLRRGVDVWWDRSIVPGDDLEDTIFSEIDRAKVCLILWTANSLTSRWVNMEAKRAQEARKYQPIFVDPEAMRGVSIEFREVAAADLSNVSGIEQALLKYGIAFLVSADVEDFFGSKLMNSTDADSVGASLNTLRALERKAREDALRARTISEYIEHLKRETEFVIRQGGWNVVAANVDLLPNKPPERLMGTGYAERDRIELALEHARDRLAAHVVEIALESIDRLLSISASRPSAEIEIKVISICVTAEIVCEMISTDRYQQKARELQYQLSKVPK
ncbi:MAG: hypothetical protein C0465_25770 [Ralstonia sp.]|uniref:toll/interleukin-1 receptor domain-containing protein n=1 Tax=Ralstonia sp. TaxID=54061 RepID=UPI00257EF1F4|nr:toll/interleukin-1 receptor domain-containing protein [Ralstonia sp.]MBA4233985.1 hypothetical protein [Ralstonia sp.]